MLSGSCWVLFCWFPSFLRPFWLKNLFLFSVLNFLFWVVLLSNDVVYMCMLPVRLNGCCSCLRFLKLLRFPVSVKVLQYFYKAWLMTLVLMMPWRLRTLRGSQIMMWKQWSTSWNRSANPMHKWSRLRFTLYVFLCTMRRYTVFCFDHEFWWIMLF